MQSWWYSISQALELNVYPEDTRNLQGNLRILAEQILWQTYICISLCDGFFISLTSCVETCLNVCSKQTQANAAVRTNSSSKGGDPPPWLQLGALWKNKSQPLLSPLSSIGGDRTPPKPWAVAGLHVAGLCRFYGKSKWWLGSHYVPLSDASSLNSSALLNCPKLYFCSVTLTNGRCGHYFHFKLDPSSCLHGWINEWIYFTAVLIPQ